MPFNEKVNLEQYFKDEIERVSSSEICAVETQIEDIRSNAIKDIEAEAQQEAGMVEEDGTVQGAKEALLADAVGTTVGAILGTSTVTTVVESSTGIVSGGRTGLTAAAVSILFFLSLFLSPLILSVPLAATTPVLVIVGYFMIGEIRNIDFANPVLGIPAFLTILMMVTSFSISDGIMFGVISYVFIKAFRKEVEDISVTTLILTVLFILKFIIEGISY